MTNPLRSRDLLVLMEMCLDAEDRCAERSAAARRRGDLAGADREDRLQQRYVRLRYGVFRRMGLRSVCGPALAREAARPALDLSQVVQTAGA